MAIFFPCSCCVYVLIFSQMSCAMSVSKSISKSVSVLPILQIKPKANNPDDPCGRSRDRKIRKLECGGPYVFLSEFWAFGSHWMGSIMHFDGPPLISLVIHNFIYSKSFLQFLCLQLCSRFIEVLPQKKSRYGYLSSYVIWLFLVWGVTYSQVQDLGFLLD